LISSLFGYFGDESRGSLLSVTRERRMEGSNGFWMMSTEHELGIGHHLLFPLLLFLRDLNAV